MATPWPSSGEGYAFNADAKSVLKITFTADATFQGGTVKIKGISISDADNNAIEAADVNVTVTAGGVTPPPTTYAITIATAENGIVSVDKSEATAGETVKVTATPAEGYELEAITVKSGETTISLSADNTFTMPAAAVVVSATFKKVDTPTPTDKPTLSMADFTIKAGESVDVTLDLVQNNVTVKAFQCAFELPAGLTMAKPKAVNGTMTDDDEEPTKPSVAFNEDGNTVAVYSGEGYVFNSDATSVLKITFTASADFKGGDILIKNISISDKDNNGIEAADVKVKVSVPATPVEGPALTLVIGQDWQDNTVTGTIYLDQYDLSVKAFQCTFELPDWLHMDKPKAVAGTMTDDDEEPTKPSVAWNEESYSLAVYSGEGYLFNADVTKVLTVKFTADPATSDEEAAQRYDDKVIIKGITLSDKDNNSYDLPDYEAPIYYGVGITDIQGNRTSNEVYTITGAKVTKMTRGLYIINGKKVLVK